MSDKNDNKDDLESDSDLNPNTELWNIKQCDNIWYRIDPSKVKTIKDVVILLDAINIKFNKTHPGFHLISHLLKEEK